MRGSITLGMLRVAVASVALGVLDTDSALSQDMVVPPTAQPLQGPYVMVPPPQAPKRRSFRDRREDDVVVFTLGVSYYEAFGAGFGGNFGVYLTPDTIIELDGYEGVALWPTVLSRSGGLRVLQYFTDVFYVRGGPRYRWIEHRDFIDFDFNDYDEYTVQKDFGVEVGLGARFQWGGFVFGIDLADVYIPVYAIETIEQLVDPRNDELLAETRGEERRTLDVRVARIELGGSF